MACVLIVRLAGLLFLRLFCLFVGSIARVLHFLAVDNARAAFEFQFLAPTSRCGSWRWCESWCFRGAELLTTPDPPTVPARRANFEAWAALCWDARAKHGHEAVAGNNSQQRRRSSSLAGAAVHGLRLENHKVVVAVDTTFGNLESWPSPFQQPAWALVDWQSGAKKLAVQKNGGHHSSFARSQPSWP
jgi:hypothetical protein